MRTRQLGCVVGVAVALWMLSAEQVAAQQCVWCHICGPAKRYLSFDGVSTIRIQGSEIECTDADSCEELGDPCEGGSAPDLAVLTDLWRRAQAGQTVTLVRFVESNRARTRYIPSRGLIVVYGKDCTGTPRPVAVLPVARSERHAVRRMSLSAVPLDVSGDTRASGAQRGT